MPNSGYFDTVFGSSGDLLAVPDAVQGDGSVSYTQGYGIDYSTPVGSGGLNIGRAQMNQLFFDVTSALQQYQQHGTPAFITSAMNGGSPFSYSQYDRVTLSGVAYQSLANSNTDTPPSSKWARLDVLYSANDLSDVADAATALANLAGTPLSAFGHSFTSPGYQKLPGGLIIQFGGALAVSAGNHVVVTYSVAFPTGFLGGYTTALIDADNASGTFSTGFSTALVNPLTSAIIRNLSPTGSFNISWLSIGH